MIEAWYVDQGAIFAGRRGPGRRRVILGRTVRDASRPLGRRGPAQSDPCEQFAL